MHSKELLSAAFSAIHTNKVRSLLTALGIIIGVFSVVLLVSLVKGVQNYVTDQFNSIGSNLVFIMPGRAGINRDPATAFTDNKLDESLVDKIKTGVQYQLTAVSPIIVAGKTVSYKNNSYFSMINGGYPDYVPTFNIGIAHGRNFDTLENKTGAKVALLGSDVKTKLFGARDPVGETIKIDGHSFEVIGFLESKAPDIDNIIIVPFETMPKTLESSNISYIVVRFKNEEDIEIGIKQAELVVRSELSEDDFTILTQKDLLDSVTSILTALEFGLGAVAAISLIVGGIGIMNIMLVAVNERIKEIGLRKALGATRRDIGLQFLFESTILSLSGGIIGMLLGIGASLAARTYINTSVPLWSILISLGFSALIGIGFGTYPAFQASKKDPIEALRYE